MSVSQAERFTLIRRLASVKSQLDQLAFLPREDGTRRRRSELDRERLEIVAKLSLRV